MDKLADHPCGGFCTASLQGNIPFPPYKRKKGRFETPITDKEKQGREDRKSLQRKLKAAGVDMTAGTRL
jgi:hypothetical protein